MEFTLFTPVRLVSWQTPICTVNGTDKGAIEG